MRNRISKRAEKVMRVQGSTFDFLQTREKNVAPKRMTFDDLFDPTFKGKFHAPTFKKPTNTRVPLPEIV